jgi:opacity protein-like surface antigen
MNKLVLISVLAAAPVLPQTWEVSAGGGAMRPARKGLGSLSTDSPKNDDTRLRGTTGYGVRLTANTKGYYGFELGYIRSRATMEATIRTGTETLDRRGRLTIQHAFFNAIAYMMPKGERWRPFLTVGMQGQLYSRPNIDEFTDPSSRNYGFNYGGGLKIKLAKHFLVRLDVRDYIGGAPYGLTLEEEKLSLGTLRHLEGSFGLSITF